MTMTSKVIQTKMGTAKRNRGTGVLNWTQVAKVFPDYREHIYRIRNDQKKLVALAHRLIKRYGMRRQKMILEVSNG